ncbi:hypothetical protein QF000_004154 [Paraburkholderia atlantica]
MKMLMIKDLSVTERLDRKVDPILAGTKLSAV